MSRVGFSTIAPLKHSRCIKTCIYLTGSWDSVVHDCMRSPGALKGVDTITSRCSHDQAVVAVDFLRYIIFTDVKMKRGARVINMAEQAHELTLLFNASMKPLLHQHSFVRGPNYLTNKTRLISIIAQCFTNDYVQCKQLRGTQRG